MFPIELTKYAGKNQFQATLTVWHACQRWIFRFVFEHSLRSVCRLIFGPSHRNTFSSRCPTAAQMRNERGKNAPTRWFGKNTGDERKKQPRIESVKLYVIHRFDHSNYKRRPCWANGSENEPPNGCSCRKWCAIRQGHICESGPTIGERQTITKLKSSLGED